jgi:hypothetical protein
MLRGVEVQRTLVEDRHPAEALVALSADADLPVVGSTSHGLPDLQPAAG